MSRTFLVFSPFRLDVGDARLWKGSQEIRLRRKPFAILRYLAEHPRRLVSQEELVKEIWGNIVVSESAIRTQLYDLRQAVGEGVIETVVGRGYRFLPAVTTGAEISGEPAGSPVARQGGLAHSPAATPGAARADVAAPAPVGRADELQALSLALARAAAGERQMIFVTGEPGIGKSTLVNAFLSELPADRVLAIRGQCIEQSGHGEPYLPLLEGLRRLCEAPGGEAVTAALGRRSPTWVIQMPGLFPDAELRGLQQRTAGATQDRMLRELCEALEHLSIERPVVLALEDLQWSDLSTINVVSMLGSRRSSARLLVIGTARQADLLQATSPLKTIYRELLAHGHAQVVTPGALSPEMVSQYLRQRFEAHRFPDSLAAVVHRITGGTPLFMVSVVDDLVKQRLIANGDGLWALHSPIDEVATRRPDSVGQLIDIQIERLTQAEQRVLEVSSAIGMEFTAGLVAAALETSVDAVEEVCDGLVRREHTLRPLGPRLWPDGTTQSRYAFRHNLYQAVALERSSLARRRVWHRKFAERLQVAYAGSTAEVAVELALHFERANEWLRAAEFYAVAGERAASRFAGLDATVRFKAGLELVKQISESPERDAVELRLLIGIAPRLVEQQISDPPWSMVHARILLLSQSTGLESPPWSAVFARWISSFLLGDLPAASLGAERLLAMAEERQDSEILASAILAQAVVCFFRGKLGESRLLFDRLRAIYDGMLDQVAGGELRLNHPDSFLGTFRPLQGSVLWMMGYPDQARVAVEQGVEESRGVKSPYAQALGWSQTSHVYFWRREPTMVLQATARASDLGVTHGFPVWRPEARILSGWARVVVGRDPAAFQDLEEGLAERLALGPRGTTLLAVVHAEACLVMGEVERGLAGLDEAIAFGEDSGEGMNMAELHRLKGLLLGQTNRSDADAYLRRALEIAQASSAKAFELRAAIGLARLWQSTKQHPEAISRLAEIVAWFTEGFSGADLTEARQLLDEARQQRPQGRRRRA